jgi:DNA-binding NarL/FixJ family response regulator
VHVLIVDDSPFFRRFVHSILGQKQDFHVVGEASDALDATQKAEELKPDLILLDIGLPKLNGIEGARRMRELAPSSKILFLSVMRSSEVAAEALRIGASGYVVKSDAAGELLSAVEAVLRGELFVSSSLAGHPDLTSSKQGVLPLPPAEVKPSPRHAVAFYPNDASLLRGVGRFVETAISGGNAVIVIATEAHRINLLARMQAQGLEISTALEESRYIALDAAEVLSNIMSSGMPAPVRFSEILGSLITEAAEVAKGARVTIFAECVHLLWAQGNLEAAIQFEKLDNQLAKRWDSDILCGYSLSKVKGGMDADLFRRICAEHSVVHGLGY